MFKTGVGYSFICSTRSVLNNIIYLTGDKDISKHLLIQRFMRGVFSLRPPKVKCTFTWNINVLLTHLKKLGPNTSLPFHTLSKKLATLLMLISGTRVNTIFSMALSSLRKNNDTFVFLPEKLLKHFRPSHMGNPIQIKKFSEDMELCPYNLLTVYIQDRVKFINEVNQLFITTKKHYKPFSRNTISR